MYQWALVSSKVWYMLCDDMSACIRRILAPQKATNTVTRTPINAFTSTRAPEDIE